MRKEVQIASRRAYWLPTTCSLFVPMWDSTCEYPRYGNHLAPLRQRQRFSRIV